MMCLTKQEEIMQETERFIHRDISWLGFNGRVLEEAGRAYVPLLERLNFLGIFSSNLDEFYRVRIPVLMALKRMDRETDPATPMPATPKSILKQAKQIIRRQQECFGQLLAKELIPQLRREGIVLLYNEPIPEDLRGDAREYFFNTIAGFIEVRYISDTQSFFPENNLLYFAVQPGEGADLAIVSIPSHLLPRFFTVQRAGVDYVIFIDDVIRQEVSYLFGGRAVGEIQSFKITRDADISLDEALEDDVIGNVERKISLRDMGLATRLLYDPDMPKALLAKLTRACALEKANRTRGGRYHHLKDLMGFPIRRTNLLYARAPIPCFAVPFASSLHEEIAKGDLLINTPYESFDPVVRFFNEAAVSPDVVSIQTTIYRVAKHSRILQALISAAKNGKTVMVFVELKARFDEENNVRWAKRMKEAGIRIVYSIPGLKVHAKAALVTKAGGGLRFLGLLATGNLNEDTARVYADHFLLTANQALLQDLEYVFGFLEKRRKPLPIDQLPLGQLWVAQFNLKDNLVQLVDREIAHAKRGLPAGIALKLNNLDDDGLIVKLYEASAAGVDVTLIVRAICRIKPGVPGLSERISVRRIVGRYLEHARIYRFHNGGAPQVYMGSADWMHRNIYHRIEICFPIVDEAIKETVQRFLALQQTDGASAVCLDEQGTHRPVCPANTIFSQVEIAKFLAEKGGVNVC